MRVDKKIIILFLIAGCLPILGVADISREENTDRPGMDYTTIALDTPDPSLCEQKCLDDEKCKAYTYVKPGIQGETAFCWLKNAVPDSKQDSCCTSGVRGGTSNLLLKTPVIPPIGKLPVNPIQISNPVVLDFEDVTTTGPGTGGQVELTNQGALVGIAFNKPVVLDYSQGIDSALFQGFAHSGTNAIEQCYSKEFCSNPIEMNFSAGQEYVKVWVGYSGILKSQKNAILTAFDSSGKMIDSVSTTFKPSSVPIPISTPLEITSVNPDIYSVQVYLTNEGGKIWITNALAVDDVEYGKKVSG